MKKILFLFPLFITVFGISVLAQEPEEKGTVKDGAKLQKEAVDYLRDTVSEINTLRTVENRISFSSELANLLWYHDEKGARKMFAGVSDSFIQLLTEANASVNGLGGMRDGNDSYGGFSFVPDERARAIRKIYKALAVREQVAMAIAEHDAQLSYDFVVRTTATITDRELLENLSSQNERLERAIIERMMAGNLEDSIAFGRRSLKRGFKPELVDLARKVYRKDPEAAIEFGKELVDKVRSEAGTDEKSLSNIYAILKAGSDMIENPEKDRKPLFAKAVLDDLAVSLAENLLRSEEFESYMLDEYVELIEKYSPGHARRVAAKFAEKDEDNDPSTLAARAAADAVKAAADKAGSDSPSAEQAAEQAKAEERQQFMEELQGFGSGELSKEEKSKFIEKARRIVSEMKDPTVKIAALATLARQVRKLGDVELAAEIMREANAMVKSDPQNFMDYMLVWSLVAGYSEVAPEEALSMLENAIYRLNDTIDAAVKVAQFVDVQGELVIDGEVQLGAFGGSMIRGALGMLGESEGVFASLAESDFDRTKALAQRFEKPEVRILARFMILRSVLVKSEKQDLKLLF